MIAFTPNELKLLKTSPVFQGLNEEEIINVCHCLDGNIKEYKNNEFILRPGEKVLQMGVILQGNAYLTQEDFWGNKVLIAEFLPGQVFAETYALLKQIPHELSVTAKEGARILLLDCQKLTTTCQSCCMHHIRVVQNVLIALARKNVNLTQKMEHLSKRTIRERLLSYLSMEVSKQGSTQVFIPFDRQDLADFLAVDRSALSKEISKLKAEGIINCERNVFQLLQEN